MKISQMKNIIVLKDLPSNLVEEAIVILKNGSKVKNKEIIEKSYNQIAWQEQGASSDIALKEAEYIVKNYMQTLEKPKEETSSIRKMKLQYQKLKLCTIFLALAAIVRNNHKYIQIEKIKLLFFYILGKYARSV